VANRTSVFPFLTSRYIYIHFIYVRDEVSTVMYVMKANKQSTLIQRAAVYILRRLAYYPQGFIPFRPQITSATSIILIIIVSV
jgi:hypothetical protein